MFKKKVSYTWSSDHEDSKVLDLLSSIARYCGLKVIEMPWHVFSPERVLFQIEYYPVGSNFALFQNQLYCVNKWKQNKIQVKQQ